MNVVPSFASKRIPRKVLFDLFFRQYRLEISTLAHFFMLKKAVRRPKRAFARICLEINRFFNMPETVYYMPSRFYRLLLLLKPGYTKNLLLFNFQHINQLNRSITPLK